MERWVRKQEYLDVVGVWEGEESGPVIDWLNKQGPAKFKYMIQVEEPELVASRVKVIGDVDKDTEVDNPEVKQRKMLAVVGSGYYRSWNFDEGSTIAVRDDGLLTELYPGQVEQNYDRVAQDD